MAKEKYISATERLFLGFVVVVVVLFFFPLLPMW